MYEVVTKYIRITSSGKTNEIIAIEDVSREIERLREENKQLKQELQQIKSKKRDSGYLTPREAAEYIGVSVQTIYNMRSKGTFVLHRDYDQTKSGRPRFKLDALDSWLTGKRSLRAVGN